MGGRLAGHLQRCQVRRGAQLLQAVHGRGEVPRPVPGAERHTVRGAVRRRQQQRRRAQLDRVRRLEEHPVPPAPAGGRLQVHGRDVGVRAGTADQGQQGAVRQAAVLQRAVQDRGVHRQAHHARAQPVLGPRDGRGPQGVPGPHRDRLERRHRRGHQRHHQLRRRERRHRRHREGRRPELRAAGDQRPGPVQAHDRGQQRRRAVLRGQHADRHQPGVPAGP